MIFRHEYVHLIYLREIYRDLVKYKRQKKQYLPDEEEGHCKICFIQYDSNMACILCDSSHMKQVLANIWPEQQLKLIEAA